jgi:hypothetical protein
MLTSDSPYANPQPYDSPGLERHALEGRLAVAKGIRDRCVNRGDTARAASWQAIVDQLLEHLAHVDDRAVTAAIDRADTDESGVDTP